LVTDNVRADRAAPFRRLRSLVSKRVGSNAISREVVCNSVQVLDFLACVLGGVLAMVLYFGMVVESNSAYGQYVYPIVLAAIILSFSLYKSGSYEFKRLTDLGWQTRRVVLVCVIAMAILSMLAFVTKEGAFYSRGWAVVWVMLTMAQLLTFRLGLGYLIDRWSKQGRLARMVAVVGADQVGEQLLAKLQLAGENEILVAGVFDDRRTRLPPVVGGYRVLGTTDDLISFVRNTLIDQVIIALPLRAEQRIGDLVAKLRSLPVDLRLSIDPINSFPMRGIAEVASARMIEILDRPLKNWSRVTKWLEDRLLSTILLVIFAPLMALIALAIRIESPGPVLFVQDRFGFNDKIIRVLKFRTMRVENCDQSGATRTVPNDSRITRIGHFLRSFSLDELPQLINVLRGEMSLVGPRPHVPAMKAGERLYHEAVDNYCMRHHVLPGLTGWAQVNNSRGQIDSLAAARRRVELDIYYIDNWSLWLDFKILFMTARVALSRENAY
jgi:Undecaprenyl-phosphate glucose phosphotransferase